MFKYIGLGLAIVGGIGGLYFAFQENLFWTIAGIILFLIGLFAISKG